MERHAPCVVCASGRVARSIESDAAVLASHIHNIHFVKRLDGFLYCPGLCVVGDSGCVQAVVLQAEVAMGQCRGHVQRDELHFIVSTDGYGISVASITSTVVRKHAHVVVGGAVEPLDDVGVRLSSTDIHECGFARSSAKLSTDIPLDNVLRDRIPTIAEGAAPRHSDGSARDERGSDVQRRAWRAARGRGSEHAMGGRTPANSVVA